MDYIKLNEELDKEKIKLNELKEKYLKEISFVENLNRKLSDKNIDNGVKIDALSKYRAENPIYDEYHRLSFHIKCLENELSKINCVEMNNILVTSDKSPIILTHSIASCIGVLLYLEDQKKAVLGHFSSNKSGDIEDSDAQRIYNGLIEYLVSRNLYSENIKYFVVPGVISNVKRINIVVQKLRELLDLRFEPLSDINKSAVRIEGQYGTLEFAFDANSGKFITESLFSNDVDYMINNVSYKRSK